MDVLNFIDRADSYFKKKEGKQVLLKLLKIEVKFNLNLIRCLKFEGMKQKEKELSIVSSQLKFEILQLFLVELNSDKSLLRNVIDSYVDREDDEAEELVSNIVQKIMMLKAICEMDLEGENNYVDFRVRLRMENLQQKITQLSEVL